MKRTSNKIIGLALLATGLILAVSTVSNLVNGGILGGAFRNIIVESGDGALALTDYAPAGVEELGVTHSLYQSITLDTAAVKALMDGTTTTVATLPAGAWVTDVYFGTVTGAGVTSTVNIGTGPSLWSDADPDGFVAALDVNPGSVSKYRATLDGAALDDGALSFGGDVILKSSTDITVSSWTGFLIIEFVVNNGI